MERAQAQYDEEEARKLQKKIKTNSFDFNDFYNQIQQIKKMGNMKDLMGMIPGLGKALRDVEIKDDAFKPVEAMIQSMTPYERANPQVLDAGRRKRIAAGSGTTIAEVNKVIKQLEDTKKMMRAVSKPGVMQAMRKMKRR